MLSKLLKVMPVLFAKFDRVIGIAGCGAGVYLAAHAILSLECLSIEKASAELGVAMIVFSMGTMCLCDTVVEKLKSGRGDD